MYLLSILFQSYFSWRGDITMMFDITGVIYICAVLSGTKYGLRQTRGKFGLGAKTVNILHELFRKKLSKLYVAENCYFLSSCLSTR